MKKDLTGQQWQSLVEGRQAGSEEWTKHKMVLCFISHLALTYSDWKPNRPPKKNPNILMHLTMETPKKSSWLCHLIWHELTRWSLKVDNERGKTVWDAKKSNNPIVRVDWIKGIVELGEEVPSILLDAVLSHLPPPTNSGLICWSRTPASNFYLSDRQWSCHLVVHHGLLYCASCPAPT